MDVEARGDGVLLLLIRLSLPLLSIKPEPWRCRSDGVPSPPSSSSRLVKPKTESVLLPMEKEHKAMFVDEEIALKWARDNYVREEMERKHRALEKTATRRRGREEGGIVILDDGDEEVPGPSNPIHQGDRWQGCSKDGGGMHDDDSDDNDDYTNLCTLLGM
ncbi:Cysteine-rich receptor-like protein kinase 10 [Hordeum vulgare]|nr:Cysteine-rich receptor-like protein kinase 10 [Hordeum vulgare]